MSLRGDSVQREDEHPSERYLRYWIGSGLTGCSFARKFARQGGRVAFLSWVDEPSDELTNNLDPFFEQSRHEGTFPFVLLPRLRDASGIARLIALLTSSRRWEVARIPWTSCSAPRSDVAVGLFWRTPNDLRAAAMGFAPLGSMPVTRRAPYVALALWPGDRENPYFDKSPPGNVSFADANTGLTRETHEKLWETSARDSRDMLRDPFDDVVWMRRVTFCLPEPDVARYLPNLMV
jgi:hypothetical protein